MILVIKMKINIKIMTLETKMNYTGCVSGKYFMLCDVDCITILGIHNNVFIGNIGFIYTFSCLIRIWL